MDLGIQINDRSENGRIPDLNSNQLILPEDVLSYRDIPYVAGGHERQKLDLYIPGSGKNYPLIIWVHGGAFKSRSKQDHVPLEYLSLDYAVASIDFRLSTDAIFPAQ